MAEALSLYERIGGPEAVFAAVKGFYDRVMADESLSAFFTHLDLDKQIDKQVAFLTMAFGGPSRYSGKNLRVAHAPLVTRGLNDGHFDSVARHLRDTLDALGVPADTSTEVMSLVATTRADVLGR